METGWIQVFVLTLTQCIAPTGKMVCQLETVQYQFAGKNDCDRALVQMIELAERADNILVDHQQSSCKPGVMESQVYASGDDARLAVPGDDDVVLIDNRKPPADFMQSAHADRLKALKTCEESAGVAPCRIGDIIVEAAADSRKLQVWKQQ